MFTALIWDFDGTLFDTYPGMAEAARRVLLSRGHSVDSAEILGLMKISMNYALSTLREKFGLDDTFIADYKSIVTALQIERAKPYPGIPELLRECAKEGRSHFIYTHRGTSVYDILREHHLLDVFTDIIHNKSEDFQKKPSPASIQILLERYHIQPECAVMIGDRAIDIESARNAGICGCLFDPDGLAKGVDAEFKASTVSGLRGILAL